MKYWLKKLLGLPVQANIPKISVTSQGNPLLIEPVGVAPSMASSVQIRLDKSKGVVSPFREETRTAFAFAKSEVNHAAALVNLDRNIQPWVYPAQIREILCRLATILDCLEKGMPLQDLVPLAIGHEAKNGNGHWLLDILRGSTRLLDPNVLVDYTKIFPHESLYMLDKVALDILRSISSKTQSTLAYEVVGAPLVNRDLVRNRLVFLAEQDLSSWLNYLNLSPNNHPDYGLVLEKAFLFPVDKHMKDLLAYDLKMGQVQPSKNIVKGCHSKEQLSETLIVLHKELVNYLKTQQLNFSREDRPLAESLINQLEFNLDNFSIHGNLHNFRSSYHGFHEQYSSFLCRNQIGYNFVVHFDIENLHIPESSRTFFRQRYDYHMHSSESAVSTFTHKVSFQNERILSAKVEVQDFINYYLNRH